MAAPTLRSLALAGGVSVCTVSRALRGHPKIGAETRDKIRGLALKMGYRVNPFVSSWMAHVRATKKNDSFQGCLAVVDLHVTPLPLHRFTSPRRQLRGAEERAREMGFKFEVFRTRYPDVNPARLAQILHSRGIAGVILPLSANIPRIDFPCEEFACVAIGRRLAEPAIQFATSDQFATVLTACEEMAKLGYRRLGMALPSAVNRRVEGRFSHPYLGWQASLPLRRRLPIFYYGEIIDEDEFMRWISRHRPDGFLCFDELDRKRHAPHELGPQEILRQNGIGPEEIGIATLDWCEETTQDWAGFDQRHDRVGAAAVELIAQQIHRNERGLPKVPMGVIVEGVWHAGPTAPPRPGSR